jgi:hypothetical protein
MTISNRPKSPRTRDREDVIRAWLLEQARKGRLPASAVGSSAGLPIFVKTMIVQEGDELVAKCCVVAGGSFTPIVVRVNLPALAKMLAARGMLPKGDSVAGFGSFLEGIGKAVLKNPVSKAVGKVVSKVAKSPIVQIANPMMAITTHTISKGAGGKGTVKGKLGGAIDLGAAIVAPRALAHVSSQAVGALGLGAKTVMASQAGKTVSNLARQAQTVVAQGKQAASLLKLGKLQPKTALPLIKKAVAMRANVAKIAPALAIKTAGAKKVQAAIANVAAKAKAGSKEAKQAATAIAAAAKMTDKISAAQQVAASGNAGFVLTADGKIRRSPKGKFVRTAALPMVETLYRGAKEPPLRGSFAAVSGARERRRDSDAHERRTLVPAEYRALEAEVYRALVEDDYQRDTMPAPPPTRGSRVSGHQSWGGDRDPGDEYDGPVYAVRYADPSAWPNDWMDPYHKHEPVTAYEMSVSGTRPDYQLEGSIGAGRRTRPVAKTKAAARARALLELARARHHLQKTLARGTKVGNDMASLMVGADLLVGEDVGTPPELTEMSDGLPDVDLLVSGEPWGVGASIMVGGPSGWGTNELVGCGEPNISGAFPSYLLTSRGLRHPVIRRRVKAWLKGLTPKVRRRVMSRLPAIVGHNDRVSGAVRSANVSIGSHGPGWAAVSGGIPGGYELIGSHRQAGLLTP